MQFKKMIELNAQLAEENLMKKQQADIFSFAQVKQKKFKKSE
jgi:hypothetical protein